jgi:hypothetical protein
VQTHNTAKALEAVICFFLGGAIVLLAGVTVLSAEAVRAPATAGVAVEDAAERAAVVFVEGLYLKPEEVGRSSSSSDANKLITEAMLMKKTNAIF